MKHQVQAQPQQPVYQPTRRRVQRHVAAAKPAMQPQQALTKADISFQAQMIKLIVVLFLAYIIVPLDWLHQLGRLL